MDMLTAKGIKEVFLAPIAGQSASIMALLFIKMDILSATGIEKIFLAPIAEIHFGSKDIKRKNIHFVKTSKKSDQTVP